LAADPGSVDCRNASRLLSAALERALTQLERAALRRHLDACLMCRNFESQLEFLRRAATRFRSG
jgi:predicted anti-sigma-YlaC factor YlaD